MKWSTYTVLCAAYCDKEATLDFLAMEDKPSGRSGRYSGKSVNVQYPLFCEMKAPAYGMAISKQIMDSFWISEST